LASHLAATGLSGNSRPRRLKIAEPSGRKSRVADQPSLAELRLGKPACGSPGKADRFDSRSNSLGSASLPTPTSLCSPLRFKLRPGKAIWNVNRRSAPGLFAKQCAPGNGSVMQCNSRSERLLLGTRLAGLGKPVPRHSAPLQAATSARSSKRAGGLIPRIALDQCRVPELTGRVPFLIPEREVAPAASLRSAFSR